MADNPTPTQANGKTDPTANVKDMLWGAVNRTDDLRAAESRRVDEKFKNVSEKFNDIDVKYQIQFNAAKEALGIALIAQEKGTAAALEGTREAINKAEVATDKRFSLLSEKIDGVQETINKNTGSQGIYVTHNDLTSSLEKLQANIEATLRPVITFMNSQMGKSSIEDPIMNELLHEVKKMRESNATTKGTGQGMSTTWGWIVAGVATILAVLGFLK